MSRAAVYDALRSDSGLAGLGIDNGRVFPNYSLDSRPISGGPFIILRWDVHAYLGSGTLRANGAGRGGRDMTLWVHLPVEESTDFTRIDAIHDRCEAVLTSLEQVDGADGYTLTCIAATGRGGDLRDDGYNTITRNAGFKVLSRLTV